LYYRPGPPDFARQRPILSRPGAIGVRVGNVDMNFQTLLTRWNLLRILMVFVQGFHSQLKNINLTIVGSSYRYGVTNEDRKNSYCNKVDTDGTQVFMGRWSSFFFNNDRTKKTQEMEKKVEEEVW